MPEAPFLAHFHKDGMNLYFIAARHAKQGPTLALIRETLRGRRVRLAVIEGFRGPRFADAAEFVQEARQSCGGDFCEEGEPYYTAMLAAEKGIPAVGGESSLENQGEQARFDGFTREDLAGYAFFRSLAILRNGGRLDPDRILGLWKENRGDREAMAGEAAAARFTYADFRRWYQKRNGFAFEPDRFDPDEDAPRQYGRLFTQRLSASTERSRNRSLIRLLSRRLLRERDVLVVYGSNHFAATRAVLEAMLGEPEFHLSSANVTSR